MRPLTDATVLELWERCRRHHPVDRALLFLGAAYPQESFDRLADLPVGRRDAGLLKLRCATFGPKLALYMDCPRCNERLEFSLDSMNLLEEWKAAPEAEPLEVSGMKFRLPTSRDLARITDLPDENEAAKQLARLCLLDQKDGEECSGVLLQELDERFSHADPAGNIQLDLRCPVCGHGWDEAFDISEYFWEEIEAKARGLLQEIHSLARVYGWSEREILSLSPERRAAYLEMVDR